LQLQFWTWQRTVIDQETLKAYSTRGIRATLLQNSARLNTIDAGCGRHVQFTDQLLSLADSRLKPVGRRSGLVGLRLFGNWRLES